ncbi:MAG: hypothetical protein R3F48_16515 [Candidatus Zixiibacteriota bacterium]
MSAGKRSFVSTIVYMCIGGGIIFAAVFFGVRAGLAVRTSGVLGIDPNNLTNNTQLVIGQKLPEIQVFSNTTPERPLHELYQNTNTVVAFLMPGCGPCAELLTRWRLKQLSKKAEGYQVILVAATSADLNDISEITELGGEFPIYMCDFVSLNMATGIETFPTIFGIKRDGSIVFISSGYNQYIENDFFRETFDR